MLLATVSVWWLRRSRGSDVFFYLPIAEQFPAWLCTLRSHLAALVSDTDAEEHVNVIYMYWKGCVEGEVWMFSSFFFNWGLGTFVLVAPSPLL